MAITEGINAGFVKVAPTGDLSGSGAVSMSNRAWAIKFVAPLGAIKVTEMGWWCDAISTEANFELGIYSHDSGNNKPNTLLGVDSTNAKGTTIGWKVATGLNIAITAGTTYWLASQLDIVTPWTGLGGEFSSNESTIKIIDSLTNPWGTSDGILTSNIFAIYAVYESVAVTEGYLEITGVTAPTAAHVGNLVNFTVHTKNTGVADNFRVELSGGLIGYQEFSLGAGLTKDVTFSFTMPSAQISITIKTFHLTEEGWVWDVTSTWDVNRWY